MATQPTRKHANMAHPHSWKFVQMKTRTAARRGTLSKERILRAALQVADEEGLDALSLRRIAAKLGVSAMSLYRHYRDKAEIEVSLVDHVVGSYQVTDHDEGDWREWVYVTCANMREVLCAHPGLMALLDKAFLNSTQKGVHTLGVAEAILGRLRSAGLALVPAARLYNTLMAVTLGSVMRMNRSERRAVSGARDKAGDEPPALDRSYEGVPVRQFPQVAAMASGLEKGGSTDEFKAVVLQIIDAFAPRSARPVAPRRRAPAVRRRPASTAVASGHESSRRR